MKLFSSQTEKTEKKIFFVNIKNSEFTGIF